MDQIQHDQTTLISGMRVLLRAFDEIPEHQFEISEVYDDCIGGYSLTGPLAGEYGEPEFELIIRVLD